MARLIACALAATALAALVLLGVLNGIAISRGEESFGVLGFAFLALGVLAPVCVGLFLLLQRPRTLVAWILLVGGLSVVVVMAAYGLSAVDARGRPRLGRSAPGRCSSRRSGSCSSPGRSRSPTCIRTGGCPRRAGGRWRASRSPRAAGRCSCCSARTRSRARTATCRTRSAASRAAPLVAVFWACWVGVLISLFGGALALRARYKAGDRERRRQVLWLAYGALLVPLWLGGSSLWGLRLLADQRRRPPGARPAARLAGRRRRGGRDAARPLLDRPPVQPHARLRAADRAARRHVRRGRAARRAPDGRLGARRRRRHAGRRARLPAAARPPAARSSTAASPAPATRASRWCTPSSTTSATVAPSPRRSARCSPSRSRIPAPRSSSGCPRRAPTPTASAISSRRSPTTGARARRSGATAARSACCCTTRR